MLSNWPDSQMYCSSSLCLLTTFATQTYLNVHTAAHIAELHLFTARACRALRKMR